MSKNGLRGCIVLAVILAVFSVIAFAAPFSMTAAFWIAFISGVIAILFQIYVFGTSFSKGKDAKSRFYGFPIARIGIIYLVVQLAVSIAEMAWASKIPAWVVLIINVIIFAVAAIGCIAAETVRDEVVRQDVQSALMKHSKKILRSLLTSSSSAIRSLLQRQVRWKLIWMLS